MTQLTHATVKAHAKVLRQALHAGGIRVSHADALELVARQHGARDWNTLHARLSHRNAAPEPALVEGVTGRYLGQAYGG